MPTHPHQNRLIHEKSPYLLQHAHNPVDWYPWGEEAFAKAKAEDKPIFLSIGYSTCHWCHVMEHESFEDETVAKLLNDTFVCIKVDREERPDIDGIYMTVCQMMTGHGGWPLTIVMTPDKKPFFAGTYFPKESRYQRIGLLDLIPRLRQVWEHERDKIDQTVENIMQALQQAQLNATSSDSLTPQVLDTAFQQLEQRFDPQYGGFGDRPKFPSPHVLTFLLRYSRHQETPQHAMEMVETTLRQMRLGGIFDHVGFGFHRYSTDERWFLPHFEKMLYDQAMLMLAYTEAYQVTRDPYYQQVVDEIFTYVQREMTDPQGGFYSAEDADSDGEEGKFYVWTETELRQILTPAEADFVIRTFQVEAAGNFREEASGHATGANILHLNRPLHEQQADYPAIWEPIRQKLFAVRENRIHPFKDDKILTDWNGLMIAALATAGRVFAEPRYTIAAERATAFILKALQTGNGRLYHRYRAGDAGLTAHLDDYAFMIWGLIELHQTTFDLRYLQAALDFNQVLFEQFWDDQRGGFFFTADDTEKLITRSKEAYDGAVPSGNGVMVLNLLRLSRLTGNTAWEDQAEQLAHAFAETIRRAPSAYAQWLNGLDFAFHPGYEVVIVGEPDDPHTQAMIRTLRDAFLPHMVIHLKTSANQAQLAELAPFTAYQDRLDDQTTVYVCQNFTCQQPTVRISQMRTYLNLN
ncbi:MAG: thioredoxin domain-containing protein [Gemmatimonadetes bacterium]|nr:MAG: thioredoxin domain-containing protein [Gemmatimonadota bacterium]